MKNCAEKIKDDFHPNECFTRKSLPVLASSVKKKSLTTHGLANTKQIGEGTSSF